MESIAKYKNFIATVIVIAVFAWVMKAMFVDYTSKIAMLQSKKEAIAKEKELVERWNRAAGEYTIVATKFFQKDPSIFKRFVENSAQLCNIAINSLSTAKNEEGLFMNVTLTIKAQSSYKNLLRFVKALDERNISIERMAIKKSSSADIEVDVVLKAAIFKE